VKIVACTEDNFTPLMTKLIQECVFSHPTNAWPNEKYQRAYCHESTFNDLSFIVADDNQPIMALLLSLQCVASTKEKCFSYFGLPILYIESKQYVFRHRQRAFRLLKAHFFHMLAEMKPDLILYQDYLCGGQISLFGELILVRGGVAAPHFYQVIDLTKSREELWRRLRKSYRSLIHWGEKNLNLSVITHEDVLIEHIQEFRYLHIQAAGRETRSESTWEAQFNMVQEQRAFMVFGRLDGKLVTSSFFSRDRGDCCYGVSASNREMFDKPLSHAVLWNAILYAKVLGCISFQMGDQIFSAQPAQGAQPSVKELNISKFKCGFGGDSHVRLHIILSGQHQAID